MAGRTDGLAAAAALSQPAGVAARAGRVAFVDSGSASLRLINLESGEVETLAHGAPLELPTAVAWHGDDLLVADALADKIFRWRATTMVGVVGGGCASPG